MRRALALLAVLAIVGAAPATARAHAQLQGSSPPRGAVLRAAPAQVALRFDEPVEGSFGAVRVYDRGGARVDAGDAFHPGGVGRTLAVRVAPRLAQGTYTATYRVLSADGHVVAGGFTFSIGRETGTTLTVAQLTPTDRSGIATARMLGIARGVQFGALALALGALAFLLLVWRPVALVPAQAGVAGEPARAFAIGLRRLLALVAAIGALSAAAAVVLQGAVAWGVAGFDALRPALVRDALGTRFGTVWGLAVPAWLLLGAIGWAALRERGRDQAPIAPALAALVPPAAFLLLLPALSGHATSQDPALVLVPANVLHVAAMSVWAGGLATLLLVVPPVTRRVAMGDRSRLLAGLLARFSPLALGAIAAILLSGLVQSYVYVRSPGHLLDTPFGRAVLVKLVLLLVLVGVGAYQRRRSLPRLRQIAAAGGAPARAGVLLRRVLRAELALIAVVLGATAALTAYPPSTVARSGPFSATQRIGPAQLQLTVDPTLTGPNQIHLYLLRPRDGAPFTRAQEVAVAETQRERAIGPLTQVAHRAGPGHFLVPRAVLGVAGDWRVRVTMRVSSFDAYTTTLRVPVR